MIDVSVAQVTVCFHLPLWFPPDRLDYQKSHDYPEGHAWAGTWSHTTYGNSAVDRFCRLKGIEEVDSEPMQPSVTFSVDPDKDFATEMERLRGITERVLGRYREAIGPLS